MRKVRLLLIAVLSGCLLFSLTSGQFLIVNNPQPADLIVVLAGETNHRPVRGLELLSQKYAPRILLDVPAKEVIYGQSSLELAQRYLQNLPQSSRVVICPIFALSTQTESQDVAHCLQSSAAHSLLVVTSDFHTRRALSTFQHELPQYKIFVAATVDPQQFGADWWKHRQWAKVNLDEWLKLAWWEMVDRWR
jgi:uncharacterized SAM-binding protein YcdF (DUF218 family)